MNIVIYARFSSHSQNEQSIEGQLKTCYDFAEKNGYTIVGEYIDRALSGTTDNRPQFLKMIDDSSKQLFSGVLVYQLDRFARNRYDSATYKARLKKNGVRVYSARENISDDASGILVEGLLESMAEYYSAELSQKVKRGLELNSQKCLATGGQRTLGYRTDENKQYIIDEEEAKTVRLIFDMYSKGSTVFNITSHLNTLKIRTAPGNEFNKSSLTNILKNKKYIGIYTFNGANIKDGMPRIIDDATFYAVEQVRERNRKAPASAKAKEEYILTTKLFCGHCKEMMRSYGGTSKTGKVYSYYACKNALLKKCNKKKHSKHYLEDIVVNLCKNQLTTENINKIAKEVNTYLKLENDTHILKRLKKLLKENEQKRDNLASAVLECQSESFRNTLYDKLPKLEQEKQDLEKQISIEMLTKIITSEQEIKFFLNQFVKGNINDIKYRKMLVNILVNKIYIYDTDKGNDKIKISVFLNTLPNSIDITEAELHEVEGYDNDFERSNLDCILPPTKHSH